MALVYSCCFWFSLRLGGILIGLFSIVQGAVILIVCCLSYNYTEQVKSYISNWINIWILTFTKDFLINIKEEPEKYITLGVTLTCIYIFVCLLFIYGAYKCNNVLMVGYILLELLRLTAILLSVATGLILLKLNTMDIGVLIGASVIGGFLLLGMFYLWLCAANLPILINEMERDEYSATLAKLEHLLQTSDLTENSNRLILDDYHRQRRNVFVTKNRL